LHRGKVFKQVSCSFEMAKVQVLSVLALASGLSASLLMKPQISPATYPLSTEISVTQTSLPCEEREKVWVLEGDGAKKVDLERKVVSDNIDFMKPFNIKTDRYNLIRQEESSLSRSIGVIGSLPAKVIFWDMDAGAGLDETRTRAVLSMLESNPSLSNLTVRVNHNKVWQDLGRLFSDEKITERNPWLARVLIGIPTSLGGELWAELSRGDYYNPMTQTAVLFGNIEAISAHELGHHLDHQRFKSDWGYSMTRSIAPVMLYQEWQASKNGSKLLMSEDQSQFSRFLIPAFLTYCAGAYYMSKKTLQNQDTMQMKRRGRSGSISEASPSQTLRYFGTSALSLYSGVQAYGFSQASSNHSVVNCAAFLVTAGLTGMVANGIMKNIIPYNSD
jgi:hypothetical protein